MGRLNTYLYKKVQEALEEDRAIVGVEPEITLNQLGYDYLDIANFEILLETKLGIYSASTIPWIQGMDTLKKITINLEKRIKAHEKEFPNLDQL